MDTLETICSRKSVRTYTGEPVSEEELDKILLAGQAAPIGMGRYVDMHLTVIRDSELLEKIEKSAAKMFNKPGMHPLYGAPTLIVVSSKAPLAGQENVTYSNAAIVAHNMILEATELGVGAVHIWGATVALAADPALVAELGLPEGFVPCCAAAVGKTEARYSMRGIPKDRIATDCIG